MIKAFIIIGLFCGEIRVSQMNEIHRIMFKCSSLERIKQEIKHYGMEGSGQAIEDGDEFQFQGTFAEPKGEVDCSYQNRMVRNFWGKLIALNYWDYSCNKEVQN